MRILRSIRDFLIISSAFVAAHPAAATGMQFRELPYTNPQVKAGWADFLSYGSGSASERVGGGPAVAISGEMSVDGHDWTILQLQDREWCGVNACSTRVFRDGEVWLSTDLCSVGAQAMSAWSIDTVAMQLKACGQTFDLAQQDIDPEMMPSGHRVPAPGWSERIAKLNRADTSAAPIAKVAARTAEVLGEPFDHNGSLMTVAHHDGLIVYAEPKASIRKAVKPGMILFRGELSDPDRVSGTAYTFRDGCEPAPYEVIGRFAAGQLSGTLTLTGRAPVRAKSGCEITSYSAVSGNAELTFEYMAPPEL